MGKEADEELKNIDEELKRLKAERSRITALIASKNGKKKREHYWRESDGRYRATAQIEVENHPANGKNTEYVLTLGSYGTHHQYANTYKRMIVADSKKELLWMVRDLITNLTDVYEEAWDAWNGGTDE